jgi:hypothetical protein
MVGAYATGTFVSFAIALGRKRERNQSVDHGEDDRLFIRLMVIRRTINVKISMAGFVEKFRKVCGSLWQL